MGTEQAAGGGGGAKSTRRRTILFRWINAARYVVGLAVMVLIVVMIAHAIRVVRRERELEITVTGGSVTVLRPPKPSGNLTFSLTIRAFNPSGLGQVYYTNVMAFLAGKSASSPSSPAYFVIFRLNDLAVMPRLTVVTSSLVFAWNGTNGPLSSLDLKPYFSDLYTGSTMRDAVLRLNGTLRTELYSGFNTAGRTFVYCCEPIFVGDEDEALETLEDIRCTEQNIIVSTNQAKRSMLNCELS